MAKTIGIDLGTTNSCMAVLEGGEPTVIPNAEGGRTTPSVVAFTKDGQRLVGAPARRQQVTNPQNTIFSIKRFMGRKFDEVSEEMTIVPYEVVQGPNGDVRVKAAGKEYAPPEISAMILQKLKHGRRGVPRRAGRRRGRSPSPRTSTTRSARRRRTPARSPASTSSASSTSRPRPRSRTGSTRKAPTRRSSSSTSAAARSTCRCSSSATASSRSSRPPATTISAATTSTRRSSTGWSRSSRRTRASTSRPTAMALQRLYEAAEKAKIELSSTMTTQINLPFITATQEGPKHLDLQLTRAKLEELTADLLERTVGPTKQALADAGLDASKIDHVVLVGGMTRMPAVQEKVKEIIGKDPHKGVNPDEVVAVGAAIQARRAQGRGQGHPPARRHAAVARHRDEGRRLHEADRAQHDDPDEEVGDVHDRRGQPAVGRGPRPPGRVGDGGVQQDARQVPARRHPAGAAGHAADRGHASTSTRTGSSTSPRRTSAPATSSRSRSRAAPACPRTR